MKRSLIFTLSILATTSIYAQHRNNLSVVFDAASTQIATTGTFPERAYYNYNYNYTIKSGSRFGIGYTRYIFKWFAVEADAMYLHNNAAIYDSYNNNTLYKAVDLISAQGFIRLSFLRYLFVDGGISVEGEYKQPNDMIYTQGGIGAEAGFGVHATSGRMTFLINPNFHYRGVFTIGKTPSNNELTELGIKFAVGYDF